MNGISVDESRTINTSLIAVSLFPLRSLYETYGFLSAGDRYRNLSHIRPRLRS